MHRVPRELAGRGCTSTATGHGLASSRNILLMKLLPLYMVPLDDCGLQVVEEKCTSTWIVPMVLYVSMSSRRACSYWQ